MKLTQQQKLLKEEQLIISQIQDLQHEIELYEEDLVALRKSMADLSNGKDDNAWQSFCEIVSN